MIRSTRLPGRLFPAVAGPLLATGVASCATSPGARSTDIASPSDVPSGAAPTLSSDPSSGASDVPSPTDAPGASEAYVGSEALHLLAIDPWGAGATAALVSADRYAARIDVLAALRER